MGSRTIYVADRDEVLFARAAELGGGLSPAIATALRAHVDHQEAAMDGYEEIAVRTGEGWTTETTTFSGRKLARVSLPGAGGRVSRYALYETRRGQIAVHVSDTVDWAGAAAEENPLWDDPSTSHDEWYRPGPRTLEVFAGPDEVAERFPTAVATAVREALQRAATVHLDI